MAVLFSVGVTILTAGFLWFYVVRPILEDFNVIGPRVVKPYQERTAHVMSRSADDDAPSRPSSPQTDNAQTDRQSAQAAPGRAELLTLYSTMRAAGISREKARPALKAVGLPLDNNLWAEALPATPADESYVTPIVGRATSARFETDPDYPYQAPAH